MNPVLVTSLLISNKKLLLGVCSTLIVLVALPCAAVFSMGGSTLTYLANSSSSETVSAVSTTTVGFYEGPEIAGNTYAWGNCTYWAYALRLKDGHSIPTSWGNANTWDDRARRDGYVVNHTPAIGAVYQTDAGEYGHVAYVIAVDTMSGNWTISEMNAPHFNVVSTRTFPASAAASTNFIHQKN